jgi:hypothetical protein
MVRPARRSGIRETVVPLLLADLSHRSHRGEPAARDLTGRLCTFRTLTLPNLDALTEIAGHWLALRWGDEPRHWRGRLQAAGRTDPEALWQDTLHGLQRLAAVARTPSAPVRTGSRRSR